MLGKKFEKDPAYRTGNYIVGAVDFHRSYYAR